MKKLIWAFVVLLLAGPSWAQQSVLPCVQVPAAAGGLGGTSCQPVSATAPLPTTIGGTISTSISPLTYSISTTASVTTTSVQLLAAGAVTTALTIQTNPSCVGNVWLNTKGATAVVGSGVLLPAGGGGFAFGGASSPIPTSAIYAISDSGTCSVSLVGG